MITYKQLTLAEIFEYRTKISFCTIGGILRIVDEDKSMKQKFEEKAQPKHKKYDVYYESLFCYDICTGCLKVRNRRKLYGRYLYYRLVLEKR